MYKPRKKIAPRTAIESEWVGCRNVFKPNQGEKGKAFRGYREGQEAEEIIQDSGTKEKSFSMIEDFDRKTACKTQKTCRDLGERVPEKPEPLRPKEGPAGKRRSFSD